MKLFTLVILWICNSCFLKGQNLPACDSLIINCCTIKISGSNTLSPTASNFSLEQFDYPGFILFDSKMDTSAIETVNYFGIGTGLQSHTMNVVAPLNLPFVGFLNLYTSFYDSLAFSFPITIPDTITGIALNYQDHGYINLYPYPVTNDVIQIETGKLQPGISHIKVVSLYGKEMFNLFLNISNSETAVINSKKLLPGAYILMLIEKNSWKATPFMKL